MKHNMIKNKISIGLMGSSQIEHLAAIMKNKYNILTLKRINRWTCLGKVGSCIFLIEYWIKARKMIKKVDVIYNVYTPESYKIFALAKKCNVKVISEWIGTDVFNAVNDKRRYSKVVSYIDQNLTCSSGLQKELKSINITSKVVPIIPFNQIKLDVAEMPLHHKVLIYMPNGREEFYGFSVLEKIFRKYTDITFCIVANNNMEKFAPYCNVKVKGILTHTQMEKIYDDISIVIRFTQHDGLSMSIIEALAKGKTVLWNQQHPYVNYVKSYDDICFNLDKILSQPPIINYDAVQYVKEQYNVVVISRNIEQIIDNILS